MKEDSAEKLLLQADSAATDIKSMYPEELRALVLERDSRHSGQNRSMNGSTRGRRPPMRR